LEIKLNEFKVADTCHGLMIYPSNDGAIGKCLEAFGEWSEGENIIMSNFIRKGDTVIDVGANIGTTVLPASQIVGHNGKIIAFEPQSTINQCLQTNLTLNDIKNVVVYNIALSNKDGWAKLNDNEFIESGRYGEAGISENGTDIKTMKLDDLKINSCSLIKLDIEGHEWEALKGGKAFLLKHRPVIYMEAKNSLKSTEECLKWLIGNNWKCYWHFSFWYRNNNFKKNTNTSILGEVGTGVGDMNLLAIPEEREQPNYLPEITNYNEKWNQENYLSFFKENKIEII
tara:strand:- start:452 stop:1306 length:855 start_codon:yes stop_codon:yes gene_type:complete